MKLGIALSGGGHRASVWGVGVLAAVVDARLGDRVASVSSVSGGSITNGVVAQNIDLRTATPQDFDDGIADALGNFATVGLFPNGPLTRGYLRSLIVVAAVAVALTIAFVTALAALGRETNPLWYALVGVGIGLALLVMGQGPLIALGAAIGVALVAVAGAVATTYVEGWTAGIVVGVIGIVALIAWVAALWLLSRRGAVVRSALARTHFGGDRRSSGTRLDQIDRAVNHVFLTTDLEAGDQFYLAPRFLYGFREGIADPSAAGTAIADAVQASAALPGAFPAVELPTGTFRRSWSVPGDVPATPPDRVWLSDGGVYDNMAEQWESGFVGRLRRWPELREIQEPADVLVVANSSAGWNWDPFDAGSWPAKELTALMRDQGVQYDVSTSRRRYGLVQTWMANERRGNGQGGVIVMVDRSPYSLVDAFTDDTDERGGRAREALAYLGDGEDARRHWTDLARKNASAPTILDALGVDVTLDLIEHSYVSTIVGLYVFHGLGELKPFDRGRFERLIRNAG
jgi:hypothetical protein